ncbi:hypothetical protein ACJX0J_024247, partial [Zea mays]
MTHQWHAVGFSGVLFAMKETPTDLPWKQLGMLKSNAANLWCHVVGNIFDF